MAEVTVTPATQRRMSAFDWARVLLLGAIFGAVTGMLGTVLVPRQAPMAGYAASTSYATPPAALPAIPGQPGVPGQSGMPTGYPPAPTSGFNPPS